MKQRSKLFRGRAAAVGLVTMASLALGGLSAATAQADSNSLQVTPHGFFSSSGVNIRSGPGTNYDILGQGQAGQLVCVYCEVQGASWYHILDRANGINGWAAWPDAILLDNDSPKPPPC